MQDSLEQDMRDSFYAILREMAGALEVRMTSEHHDTMAASIAATNVWRGFSGIQTILDHLRRPCAAQLMYEKLLEVWTHNSDANVKMATGKTKRAWFLKYQRAQSIAMIKNGYDEFGCKVRVPA